MTISICCIDTKNKIEALIALDKSIENIYFDKYYKKFRFRFK